MVDAVDGRENQRLTTFSTAIGLVDCQERKDTHYDLVSVFVSVCVIIIGFRLVRTKPETTFSASDEAKGKLAMNIAHYTGLYQANRLIQQHCNADLIRRGKMLPRTIDCIRGIISVRYEFVNDDSKPSMKAHFLIATPVELNLSSSTFSRHSIKFNGGYKLVYSLNGATEIREFISRMPNKLAFGTVVTPGRNTGPLSIHEFLRAVDTGHTSYMSFVRKKNLVKQLKKEVNLHGFAF